ncbi:DUF4304 domain-containing protein [Flagellimonas sediminis]|uniref:DUF4304 domain-containing protein n=1 Tax=Flagellimonas sediminis TaxID=2696468 RepID=A0A6I5L5C3_9FLAO|nr:DUF4304 domain-containing protein [Allomuricauda sediminis]NDV44901.1 DUF4304 domain-containing protein [Allomuricauda sediminis]
MNASEFRKLVTKHFSPKIRELGWKGSGFSFKKIDDNHVVNLFGIQGSWMGGSVCCETAIHFDFYPDFEKMTYAGCVIRKRLSPVGEGDYHWRFSNKEESNIESVQSIWTAFEKHGQKFYRDFESFPSPFDKIRPEDLEKNDRYKILDKYHVHNQIELARLLKDIHLLIGNKSYAKGFSEYAIIRMEKLAKKCLLEEKLRRIMRRRPFCKNKLSP